MPQISLLSVLKMVLSTLVSMISLRLVASTCSRRAVDFRIARRFCTALIPILQLIRCSVQLPSETKRDCISCHLISACYRMLEDISPCWHLSLLSSTTSYATSTKSNDRCIMISKSLKTCPVGLLRTLRRVCTIAAGSRRRIILPLLEIAIPE